MAEHFIEDIEQLNEINVVNGDIINFVDDTFNVSFSLVCYDDQFVGDCIIAQD